MWNTARSNDANVSPEVPDTHTVSTLCAAYFANSEQSCSSCMRASTAVYDVIALHFQGKKLIPVAEMYYAIKPACAL